MRSRWMLLAWGAIALLVSACSHPSGTAGSGKPAVTIGSMNFSESGLLAEIYAQALEANGYSVNRKMSIGSREIVEPAIEHGDIDLYPEYMATMLTYLDPNAQPSSDPAQAQQALQAALTPKNLTVLDYAPAVDTNGFVVTQATSQKYDLYAMSDLAPVANQLVLGGPPECPDRPYCIPGLQRVYGATFKDFKPLDAGGPLTVEALDAGQIDVGLLFTTDAQIAAKSYVLLADDKHLQAADNIAPVVRTALLNSAPADFKTTLNAVTAKLTTAGLTDLNKQVGVDKQDPSTVAAAWLKSQGLGK